MENASVRYAGFWRRLTAYGIDGTLVQIFVFLLIWLVSGVAHAQSTAQLEGYNVLIQNGWLPLPQPGQSVSDILAASGASGNGGIGMDDMLIGLIVSGIYNIWFTAGVWQATPGKRWCGLITSRTNGAPITLTMSAIRWFASGMSWLPFGLGYLMAAVHREKATMHDVICGTRVIYR